MKALVTGGTGFLGGALARRLQQMGWQVTALGRNPQALEALRAEDIHAVRADLTDAEAVQGACRGQEIVFHCGALSAPWGRAADFYQTNVLGTENVLRGCEGAGVGRLVHVSTPSLYFRFAPRRDVREDALLPAPVNEYVRTKQLAEGHVDAAFGRGLPVITIRPRAIFGPGDTSILPRLIDRLQTGNLRIIGDGQNLADLSYVGNVVDALLLCAAAPNTALGKKFNITNGQPVRLWDMIKRVADGLGHPFPTRHIPYRAADALATVLEGIYRLLPGQPEPPLTRYTVSVLALDATLDIQAAQCELGYQARVSIEQGIDEFVCWWMAARV